MTLLFLAATLLQAPAAPHWRFLERNDAAEFFYDDASLRRDSNAFEINTRVVFNTARNNGMRAAHTLFRFDCAQRTVAMLHLTTFDSAGRQLEDDSLTGEAAQPEPVPANTPQESMLIRYCPGRSGETI